MKLILIPLAFLITFSMLSLLGLGLGTMNQTVYLNGDAREGFYDSNDHLVAYENGTAAGETGQLIHVNQISAGPWDLLLYWKNVTSTYNVFDKTGERMIQDPTTVEFQLWSKDGLLTVVAVLIVAGALSMVALTFFGGSDVAASALLKTTLYLALWGFFSLLAMKLIIQIPLFGVIAYFVLTGIYTLGIIGSIGSGGSEI